MQFTLKRTEGDSRAAWRSSVLNSGWLRRMVDICAAAAGLVVFAPVLAVCAMGIRLSGASSVTFRQVRIGRNGKAFDLLKLTTMRDGAHLNGPQLSAAGDVRVTRIGKTIRAFGFNELPQLINVLRGEMSIVGPRPEVPEYVRHWPEEVRDELLSVRPGITGLATISYWHEASILDRKKNIEQAYLEEILPRKLQLELRYVRSRTLWLDLRVMFWTLLKALGGSRLVRTAPADDRVQSSEDK